MTVLKMEDKVQYKRHILTSGTITVESLHPMHIQLSAFFHSFLSHLHTYTYFKVALRQQNEHYIWHYEAFLVELPKALSVEKKSITRQCLRSGGDEGLGSRLRRHIMLDLSKANDSFVRSHITVSLYECACLSEIRSASNSYRPVRCETSGYCVYM